MAQQQAVKAEGRQPGGLLAKREWCTADHTPAVRHVCHWWPQENFTPVAMDDSHCVRKALDSWTESPKSSVFGQTPHVKSTSCGLQARQMCGHPSGAVWRRQNPTAETAQPPPAQPTHQADLLLAPAAQVLTFAGLHKRDPGQPAALLRSMSLLADRKRLLVEVLTAGSAGTKTARSAGAKAKAKEDTKAGGGGSKREGAAAGSSPKPAHAELGGLRMGGGGPGGGGELKAN